jgi:hypothetical protein
MAMAIAMAMSARSWFMGEEAGMDAGCWRLEA